MASPERMSLLKKPHTSSFTRATLSPCHYYAGSHRKGGLEGVVQAHTASGREDIPPALLLNVVRGLGWSGNRTDRGPLVRGQRVHLERGDLLSCQMAHQSAEHQMVLKLGKVVGKHPLPSPSPPQCQERALRGHLPTPQISGPSLLRGPFLDFQTCKVQIRPPPPLEKSPKTLPAVHPSTHAGRLEAPDAASKGRSGAPQPPSFPAAARASYLAAPPSLRPRGF